MKVGLVFPHQLFEQNPLSDTCEHIYLVEEYLFFRQYRFHKQKMAFHRASMKFYADFLKSKGIVVTYVDALSEYSDIRNLLPYLKANKVIEITYLVTTDDWLEKRISKVSLEQEIVMTKLPSSLFLNTPEELETYFANKKRYFQTDFYKHQRQKRNILLDAAGNPIGGKWTFDDENRLKYPKDKVPPKTTPITQNNYYQEAITYTEKHFPDHYGKVNTDFLFPTTFDESKAWLQHFFNERFAEFGAYEDAIVAKEVVLHHSVLTPMLNVGLLTPQYIIDATVKYAGENDIPINSTEGFIRQIIGWREFIRAVYQLKGTEERTRNYWGFTRKIPESFWQGTTGIEPLDLTIKKVLDTGYCHHIERLMVVGNFMLLCEFDPDEVYRWFMELFIDAYDWVMVPNVYGMSQFADGGLMSTKPYISGSNYLMKMSDFKKGTWQETWDALFWRFMHVHRDFFLQNPRLGMLVRSFDKMPSEKQNALLVKADKYLHIFR
jgi:deoxyribodipyrimidine photolyase-related protein